MRARRLLTICTEIKTKKKDLDMNFIYLSIYLFMSEERRVLEKEQT